MSGRNRLSRVVKTPKLQFIDSGLLATLLDLSGDEVQQDRTRFGNVLETFVFSELLKHTTTADGDYRLWGCCCTTAQRRCHWEIGFGPLLCLRYGEIELRLRRKDAIQCFGIVPDLSLVHVSRPGVRC